MSQSPVFMYLEELTDLIGAGKRVPLSNLVMVDKERCRKLLDEIHDHLPADMTAAQSVIENQKNIISEARTMAEQTRNDANMRASRAVNEANAQAQSTVAAANRQAQDMLIKAQEQAQAMMADAKDKARQALIDAENRAKQLISEQEVVTRARMEVDEIRQNTQDEVGKLYRDVYAHIDDVLAQLDRSISEKLTDIRMTRQQIDQSMPQR
jgi:vacuolar-type H+-ATPase subunit H